MRLVRRLSRVSTSAAPMWWRCWKESGERQVTPASAWLSCPQISCDRLHPQAGIGFAPCSNCLEAAGFPANTRPTDRCRIPDTKQPEAARAAALPRLNELLKLADHSNTQP